MVNRTSVVDRIGLRKLVVLSVVILGLLAPSAASASITSVFGTVTCETQGSGQRWCGNSAGTTVPSWDGTPIDVSVAFPPASGSDNNYPVVGIYHGYGGTKITAVELDRAAVAGTGLRGLQHHRPRLWRLVRDQIRQRSRRRRAHTDTST